MIHLSTQLSGFGNYYSVIDQDSSFILLSKLPLDINNTVDRIAYVGVLLFLLVFVALLVYLLQERTKKNKILQNSEQIRSEIFAKITHEFRTPLTIILGLSKQLREQKELSGNNSLTYLSAIERQGRNLSDLVNQLLDITKLQTADDSIEWKTGNIVSFVEMIFENFSIYARQQGMELQFFCNETEIETDFVPSYLQKILRNLLSNAIKYSEPGSKINLILALNSKDPKKFYLKVIDQGMGIKKEDLPHIFDLFYKVDEGDSQISSGIGLTLTRQLIEILKGTISVKSEIGKGSEFTVMLPVRRNEKKLYPYWIPVKKQQPPGENGHQADTNGLFSYQPNENDPRTTILLAEDNKDIAVFIRTIFNPDRYRLIHCHNGIEALEMAGKYLPDIVISDVIMPGMNGLNLCKEIKTSPLLSHLPVVLISAKTGYEDYIEGLKHGADAYIRKPFQAEELLIRVENLIRSHELLKEKYHRAVVKEERKESDENMHVDFLRHVTDIIYREMKNPDFSSVKLAQELAISVSQLNKKLNAATGYPASTYILQVKLSHAKKILTTHNKTIGEVAAECGVYDVNYFSRVFKKQTGVTPSQYKRLPSG
ncbi:MAG: response regulator [Porphyromonadaceae bacterium]|nr:response regulator [Porphyromonadaceae bacterium]